MKKTYRITKEKAQQALSLFEKKGGEINKETGEFNILGASGIIKYSNGVLDIDVQEKPFFIGWDFVEDKLDDFFGKE